MAANNHRHKQQCHWKEIITDQEALFIVIITELQLSIADYVMKGVTSVALAVVAVAMTTK